ncbi:MAG: hypothetical protein ACJ790_00015 [Myxococcaceae bacterium]
MRIALVLLGFVLLAGCRKDTAVAPVAPPTTTLQEPDSGSNHEEDCVNGWLKSRHLDDFGNPEGTVYAGGSPLFDESTGATKDRLTYVYEKHPDAKAACRSGGI